LQWPWGHGVVVEATEEVSEASVTGVVGLGREAEGVLRSLVRPGEPCALLDFPNHGNVGDSAIWMGTRALLERIGARVTYTCDFMTLRTAMLRRNVGKGPIFLQGGGNLGDLWPDFQRFREHVIEAFPETRVILLPQAIHFEGRESVARARQVFGSHPRLTLLVRDRQSLEIARSELKIRAILCPDLAFGLGPLCRTGPPTRDLLLLARRDKEAAGQSAAAHVIGGRVADWGDDDLLVGVLRALTRRALRPRLLGGLWHHVTRVYDAFARARLRAGIRLLSTSRVVVTDRLHGHILCVLLDIPHVVLDNSYGKLRSTLDAWTGQLSMVSRADSPEEALALAHGLLAQQRP
jgi:exopolysaccharide biosynthesis predicted pyruvyltransferase EpsI